MESQKRTIPCISIMQPWAWAICQGIKDLENRNWQPLRNRQLYRGRVLIHAPKKGDDGYYMHANNSFLFALWKQYLEVKGFAIDPGTRTDYHRGGIVGIATIIDVVTSSRNPWWNRFSRYGWLLADAQPLPFIPLRGERGLFEVSRNILTPLVSPAVLDGTSGKEGGQA